jgi:elongation factor P--(R)-beta-lysine ligase
MELHIDAEPAGDHFLRTSPELCHKKLLSRGAEKIFEIAKCFRQGERGRLHNPEYTMLEWYRTGGDYMTALADTQNLFSKVRKQAEPAPADFSNAWNVYSVEEIFEQYAGWNPVTDFNADRFDFDLVEKVEPQLPKDSPVVLKDYPAELCALARLKPGRPEVAERWELYLGGIEIANAYSELTDPVEQRARFETWGAQRRALGRPVYELDEEFFQCLETMPKACGVALGLDRLLMILTGADSLNAVLPFR